MVFLTGQLAVAAWTIIVGRSAPYAPPTFVDLDRAEVTDPSNYLDFVVGAELLVIAAALVAGSIGARRGPYRIAAIGVGALILLPSGCTLTYWSAFCPNQRFPTELVLPASEGAELVTAPEGDYTARSFVFSTDGASSLDAVTAFAEHYEAKGWTASGEPIEGQLFTIDRATTHISALLYSNVGGGQWTLDVSAADDQPGEVTVYVAVPNQSGLCA